MNQTSLVVSVLVVIVIVVLCATVFANYRVLNTDKFIVRGMVVNISSDYGDHDDAIALMLECNARMITLLAHLRAKYHIGATDEECGETCAHWNAQHTEARETVAHLLRGYNYEEIHENTPTDPAHTAYSLDKGRVIMLCLRDSRPPHTMIDINTLMFVIIHEAAHIANWAEWGHGTHFWSVFKFLLAEAARIGVYAPIDYARHPRDYCSFRLNHSPLFDARIPSIYEN
jgi:hypothetical protein